MEQHHAEMSAAIHATYAQMQRGELEYEDGIAKLVQISDEHIAACREVLSERYGRLPMMVECHAGLGGNDSASGAAGQRPTLGRED